MQYLITKINTQRIHEELARIDLTIDFENVDEAVTMSQEIVKFVTRNFPKYNLPEGSKLKEFQSCNAHQ